jgi:hypothetical protein
VKDRRSRNGSPRCLGIQLLEEPRPLTRLRRRVVWFQPVGHCGHHTRCGSGTMPPMCRRLFTALSVLSLVTCAAAATVVVASRDSTKQFGYSAWREPGPTTHFWHIAVSETSGRLLLVWTNAEITDEGLAWNLAADYPSGFHCVKNEIAPLSDLQPDGLWLFRRERVNAQHGSFDSRAIMAPNWAVLAATAVLPVAHVLFHFRRRARRHGRLCHSCGYNLTGNISGVCPECGTPTTVGVKV